MSSSEKSQAGVLAGIRVVEIAQVMAIPVCGLLLADMGADVMKIEPPTGDSFRHSQTQIIPGESKGFAVYNRGKRSVCLDLNDAQGREAAKILIARADVVLVSMKPSDVPRYGLTYEQCAEINPAIIYLDHIPMGDRGPFAEDGGYDVVVQGISGLGAITDRSTGDAPLNVRPAYSDAATGVLSALGVVAALRHRDATGVGQRVVTSLLSTGLFLGANILNWFAAVDPPIWAQFQAEVEVLRANGADFTAQRALYERRILAGGHGNAYFRHYRTADGFISVGALSPAVNARLRHVTGLHDPRTESGFEPGSDAAWDALTTFIREAEDCFRTRTTNEWIEALRAGGVPCGPFNFPPDVFNDPQVLANDFLIELEHPLLGTYKTFASPLRMDETPTAARGASPTLGEHTAAVLAEAGLDNAQVQALVDSGAAGPANLT